jgi:hypothetical protein
VAPGTYTVQVAKRADDQVVPLGEHQSFEVVPIGNPTLPPQNRKEVLKFQMQAGKLLSTITGTNGKLQEALDQLDEVKTAIRQTPRENTSLLDAARELELKLLDMRDVLTGDTTRAKRRHPQPPPILQRARNALSGSLNSTYGPTKTHRQEFAIAQQQFQSLAPKVARMLEIELVALQKKLDQAGVPWTSGRPIPMPQWKEPHRYDRDQ